MNWLVVGLPLSKRLWPFVLVAAASMAVGGATEAQTLAFSSFGPGNTHTSNNFSIAICGPDSTYPACANNGTPQPVWAAASFVPTVSGNLDYVDVATYNYGDGAKGAVMTVVADHNGSPVPLTRVLDTVNVASLGQVVPEPYVKIAPTTHPKLTAGTTYWLMLAPRGYNSFGAWYYGVNTTNFDWSTNGGATWSPCYCGNNLAFDVFVTATEE